MTESSFRWNLTPTVVIRSLWRGWRTLLLVGLLFSGLGVATALLLPAEYMSEARILPELSSGSGDALRRLASVAGFASADLSDMSGVETIRPDLYPNVLESTPFGLYLLAQRVPDQTGQQRSVADILDLPARWSFAHWLSAPASTTRSGSTGPGPLQLTRKQEEQIEAVQERVVARMDSRSGVITLTARMPDPQAAARVAQLSVDYLTQYVINYRTEKARRDLNFYAQRVAEARNRFKQAQLRVFSYTDRHRYVAVQATTVDRQQLEAELTIAQGVYGELARQHEQAKLTVQQQTPVFKILEPPTVPLQRVSPRRTLIVLLFGLIGLALASLWRLAADLNWWGQLKTVVMPQNRP